MASISTGSKPRAAPRPDVVCPGQYGSATLQQRHDFDTVLADHAPTDAKCQGVLNICRTVHNTMPQSDEAVRSEQPRQVRQAPCADSSSRDRREFHFKCLVAVVMVSLFQKRRPSPSVWRPCSPALCCATAFRGAGGNRRNSHSDRAVWQRAAGARVYSWFRYSIVGVVSIIGCFGIERAVACFGQVVYSVLQMPQGDSCGLLLDPSSVPSVGLPSDQCQILSLRESDGMRLTTAESGPDNRVHFRQDRVAGRQGDRQVQDGQALRTRHYRRVVRLPAPA